MIFERLLAIQNMLGECPNSMKMFPNKGTWKAGKILENSSRNA